MNIRQNYSFLFSNMNGSNNNNNIFYSINLADYASIKSGSYGKLLKTYYKEMESQSGNKNDVDNDKDNTVNNAGTSVDSSKVQEITDLQKSVDELQGSANKLLKKGSASLFKEEYKEADKEALYNAVSDFVSDFNTVLEKGSASTVSSIVSMTGRLKDSADDYTERLKGIGISVEEKKLTIDKDSFMNADMNQVKKLFNETNSFGYFTSQKADSLEFAANNEANRNNLYTKDGTYNNVSSGTLYTGII